VIICCFTGNSVALVFEGLLFCCLFWCCILCLRCFVVGGCLVCVCVCVVLRMFLGCVCMLHCFALSLCFCLYIWCFDWFQTMVYLFVSLFYVTVIVLLDFLFVLLLGWLFGICCVTC